jgi:hypothetical protein
MKAKIVETKNHIEHNKWDDSAILISLHGKYVLSNGNHKDDYFEGTCIYSKESSDIGNFSKIWRKDHFKRVKETTTITYTN